MATNMYLKFTEPEIKGSSTAGEHKDEHEVLSWSHGFVQPTSPTRSTAGAASVEQATHQNLTFTKYLDAGSTELLRSCWGGTQHAKVVLHCFRSDGAKDNKPVEYLNVTMEHVIISNYSVSGGPGDVPVENISLDYGKVTYTYQEQKHEDAKTGANLPASHDLEQRLIG
jgi:type VI secretion system secreted protein Hcp